MPFERARTLLALGFGAAPTSAPAAARRWRRRWNLRVAPARPWAKKARAELARISGRPAATASSPRPSAVAGPRRRGPDQQGDRRGRLRDPEDGRATLTRIYRKVGIRSARRAWRAAGREQRRAGRSAQRRVGSREADRGIPPIPLRRQRRGCGMVRACTRPSATGLASPRPSCGRRAPAPPTPLRRSRTRGPWCSTWVRSSSQETRSSCSSSAAPPREAVRRASERAEAQCGTDRRSPADSLESPRCCRMGRRHDP